MNYNAICFCETMDLKLFLVQFCCLSVTWESILLTRFQIAKIRYNRLVLSWDGCLTHRVISDRVHRLLVTLSYFRPDRFVQLLSLIPILILILYILISIDRECNGFYYDSVSWRKQLSSKLISNLSGAEITKNFSTYHYMGCQFDGV